jgi:hypothetical protein
MAWYLVAFDDELTDTVYVEALDEWHAAEIAANGLPERGRVRPDDGSTVWVLDHKKEPAVWKGWRCMHRIEISIGYLRSHEQGAE